MKKIILQAMKCLFSFIFIRSLWGVSFAQGEASLNQMIGGFNKLYGSLLFWDGLGLPFILVVMVSGGVFFTFRFNFVNIRLFKHAIDVLRGRYDKEGHEGEITHFQALTSALSATVGLGNIAGVAVAIAVGGPGAVFWLWFVAFMGMSMKFASCTFAQLYRVVHPDGKILGGPMVYLKLGLEEKGLPQLGKILSIIFAVFTIFASFGGGNLFQGNQTFELLSSQFPALESQAWLVGIVLAFFVGLVIIGGISRIGEVTSKLVPLMCGFYCLACLSIIVGHISMVPTLIYDIFSHAFSPDAAFGGFIGVLTQGVKRASFSNEAGLGSAAIAHAAAKTDRPVREGCVAMIGPFIDTHIVCTMTSLAILITGAYLEPSLKGKGTAITAHAFSSIGSFMPYFLTVAVIIFAYSTIISWSYYGEKSVEFLFGRKAISAYRMLFVIAVALGPLLSLDNVIDFADLMLLSMAFPNILGMMFLSGKIKKILQEYLQDLREEKMS